MSAAHAIAKSYGLPTFMPVARQVQKAPPLDRSKPGRPMGDSKAPSHHGPVLDTLADVLESIGALAVDISDNSHPTSDDVIAQGIQNAIDKLSSLIVMEEPKPASKPSPGGKPAPAAPTPPAAKSIEQKLDHIASLTVRINKVTQRTVAPVAKSPPQEPQRVRWPLDLSADVVAKQEAERTKALAERASKGLRMGYDSDLSAQVVDQADARRELAARGQRLEGHDWLYR